MTAYLRQTATLPDPEKGAQEGHSEVCTHWISSLHVENMRKHLRLQSLQRTAELLLKENMFRVFVIERQKCRKLKGSENIPSHGIMIYCVWWAQSASNEVSMPQISLTARSLSSSKWFMFVLCNNLKRQLMKIPNKCKVLHCLFNIIQ